MHESSGLRIDLGRLEANLAALRRLAGSARFCAVVKADGYGLGSEPIARRLVECGVDMLAVYGLDQAGVLIEADLGAPILTLGMVDTLADNDPAARAAQQGSLHVTIHSLAQWRGITDTARRLGATIPIHLHLDTGMSRGGLSEAEFCTIVNAARESIAGACTHMASSDDDPAFTADQFARFSRIVQSLPADTILHVANTATLLRERRYHLDMVRVGLGLFGYGPPLLVGEPRIDRDVELLPVARWWSILLHIARYPRGAAVGYNRTHTLTRDSILGVVPIGYADGYALTLGNRASMDLPAHHGSAPIVGKINMDQIVVDLTDIPGAAVGDEVVLYSDDPTSACAVERLATLASSSCYEMLTRVGSRVKRTYIG